MLTDKQGNVIYPMVTLKLFSVRNTHCRIQKIKAPKGKCWGEAAIQQILTDTADALERELPDEEYRIVEVGPSSFNFVWAGHKKTVARPGSEAAGESSAIAGPTQKTLASGG
jgi:hypothetical protein